MRDDQPRNEANYVPLNKSEPVPVKSAAIPGLLIGEPATLLGISIHELERMIEAAKVKTLMAG